MVISTAPRPHVDPFGERCIEGVATLVAGVEITIIGDQVYSAHELGGACARWGVRLVAPPRMDRALFVPASPREPGPNGRPRVKGERLPRLDQGLKDT